MDDFMVLLLVGGPVLALVSSEYFKYKLKIADKSPTGKGSSEEIIRELNNLRQEVGRLRDTSTQYDISLQEHLEEMQQRLIRVEQRDQAKRYQDDTESESQALRAGSKRGSS